MLEVMSLTSLCAFLMLSKLCCVSGHVVDLVGFQWSDKLSLIMGTLEEQDDVAFGVSWPLPSGLASIDWSTSNEHFPLYLPHPMIKWAWLNIFVPY